MTNFVISEKNQTSKIQRRIALRWAAFDKRWHILKETLPICLKKRVNNQCIQPVITYGSRKLTLIRKSASELRITQKTMERAMLEITRRGMMTNMIVQKRIKIIDVVMEKIAQWVWCGHRARLTHNWWIKELMEQRPSEGKRHQGRNPNNMER